MTCKTCGGSNSSSGIALPISSVSSASPCTSCSQSQESCTCDTFCEEDHVAKKIYRQYGFTLRTKAEFIWPAPGETTTLLVEGVERLSPGSVLWNQSAGYLTVESFDVATQTVVVKNSDEDCNIFDGGESFPACSDFVVGPPKCTVGDTPIPNIPYLAADFISPVEGDCAVASVTFVDGLTQGDIVSINGYEYSIGEIVNLTTIDLCNDGEGAPAGTVIEWDADGDNVANVPIFIITAGNACLRTSVSAGVLLVCDGDEAGRPMIGTVTDQLPIWNSVTARFEVGDFLTRVKKGTWYFGGTSTGSANAHVITVPNGGPTLDNGQLVAFIPGFTNTGPATLVYNGNTARAIRRQNGSSSLANDLIAGQGICLLIWNAADLSFRYVAEPTKIMTSWTPTLGGSGGMTLTGVTIPYSKYCAFGTRILGTLTAVMTTVTPAGSDITATPPIAFASSNEGGPATIRSAGTYEAGKWIQSSVFVFRRIGNANWGLGANTEVQTDFQYEGTW